jgi:hypothetical protein
MLDYDTGDVYGAVTGCHLGGVMRAAEVEYSTGAGTRLGLGYI